MLDNFHRGLSALSVMNFIDLEEVLNFVNFISCEEVTNFISLKSDELHQL